MIEPSATPNDALNLLLQWPLVILVLDGYEPQLAQIVIDTINEQSEETVTMLFNFAGDKARESINPN